MKKIAIVLFVVSAALAGCHHKKANTAGGDTSGSAAAPAGSAAGSGDMGSGAGGGSGSGGM